MGIPLWKSIAFFLAVGLFGLFLYPSERELGKIYLETGIVDKGWAYLEKQYLNDPSDMSNTMRYLKALKEVNEESKFEKEIIDLIGLFPENMELKNMLSGYYEGKLEYGKAYELWDKILEEDMGNEEIFEKCSLFLEFSKRRDELSELYERYLEDFPDKTDVAHSLLDIYVSKKDKKHILKTGKHILEISPADEQAMLRVAEVLEHDGEKDRALFFYEKMALNNISDIYLWEKYINKLLLYGKHERLIDSVSVFPMDKERQAVLAILLQGYYEKKPENKETARILVESLLKKDRTDIYLKKVMGAIYLDGQEYERAKNILEEFMASEKDDTEAAILLGEAMAALGDKDAWEKLQEEVFTAKGGESYGETPLDPMTKMVNEFWLLMKLGKKREAVDLIEADLDNEELPDEVLESAFYCSVESNDPYTSEKVIEVIKTRDRKKAYRLYRELAEYYFSKREYGKTLKMLKEYNHETGGDHRSYHVLGDVYAAMGDRSASRREYTRALELIRKGG